MGLFCNLYFYTNNNFYDIKKVITQQIIKKQAIRLYDSWEFIIKTKDKPNEFDVIFDAFAISLDKLSNDKQIFKTNEYGFPLNSEIYFDVYHEEKDWENQLFKFLGIIMKSFSENCAFEYYGDMIFIKRANEIIVDESRTSRLSKFPYEELGEDYIIKLC